MKNNLTVWKKGIKDGVPISLGYMAVSFTFGILAKKSGLTVMEAVLMSATNYTSAGQFAALSLIAGSASYLEMALAQLIINLRYSLMSCSLSQKIEGRTPLIHRLLIACGISDEMFGVSSCVEGRLNPFYHYGLMTAAMPGWVLGTFLGVASGSILPDRIISAFSIALYGMFLAVILPPARQNKILAKLILLSMAASSIFAITPMLKEISSGMKIIILTIVIAGIAAFFFPVQEDAFKEVADD